MLLPLGLEIISPPHLAFLGGKTRKTAFATHKTRPGNRIEHTEALRMNIDSVPTLVAPVAEPAAEFAPEPETPTVA